MGGDRREYLLRRGYPRRPFDTESDAWGAWERVGRIQGYEAESGVLPRLADPLSVSSATAYAAGVNWYLNRVVRFLTNYERTRFESVPGREERRDEGVLVSRFQVAS